MSNLSKQVEKLEVIVNRLEKLLEELATLRPASYLALYEVGDFPLHDAVIGTDSDDA